VAFYAIGAYTAAHFASGFWDNAGGGHGVAILAGGAAARLPGIHLNFLLVLALAVAATTVAGALIGVPTLRLRGDYIGMVTLAFGEIIGQVPANGRDIAFFGGTLTAGPNGIGPVDRVDLPFLEPFGASQLSRCTGSRSPSSSSSSGSTSASATRASAALGSPFARRRAPPRRPGSRSRAPS